MLKRFYAGEEGLLQINKSDLIDHPKSPSAVQVPHRIVRNILIDGQYIEVGPFVNIYGCTIGDQTRIGAFVEIQDGVMIGSKCKISGHTFVCSGVIIEPRVFVGHHVCFINDKYPKATTSDGSLKRSSDYDQLETVVKEGASIGSGAVIMGGITIGEDATVGAGAIVAKDVPSGAKVVGRQAEVKDEG